MNDTTKARIARARIMLARLQAGLTAQEGDPPHAHSPHYTIGALQGQINILINELESRPEWPRWTRCEDAMPLPRPETMNDWRQESDYVLVRETAHDTPMLARWIILTELDDEPATGSWVMQGRDGYELDGITEWREIGP